MTQPWPQDWPARLAGNWCPLCDAIGGGDNDHTIFLWTGKVSEARLHRHTSIPGYCIVVWRHGHVVEPVDLDAERAAAYWADVSEVGRAVAAVYRPMKMNYLTLGNVVPHLHTHVVPRLREDPAPGGPIAWAELTDVPAMKDEELRPHAAAIVAAAGREL